MTDTELAQKIVSNTDNINSKDIYHENSFIFITTNEKINFYEDYLKNRNSVLSVVSSGDQILNTILNSSFNIDAFDISRFPKYLLELKLAAIKSLNRDEYIDMFFKASPNKNDYYDDLYYHLIRDNLDIKYKMFWDNLLGFYDWTEILESRLFSSQTVSLNYTIQNNPYLKEENYNKLKGKISNANINYTTGNIKDICKQNQKKYDLINLSSIIYYIDNYKDILESFNLDDNGIILTYLYATGKFKEYYTDCDFYDFPKCNDGVMIYYKK